jgi:hypothetical protein
VLVDLSYLIPTGAGIDISNPQQEEQLSYNKIADG